MKVKKLVGVTVGFTCAAGVGVVLPRPPPQPADRQLMATTIQVR
ncbi:MAG: hypothetical protein ACYC7I_06445 [Gammaproteobacteria bacterium]